MEKRQCPRSILGMLLLPSFAEQTATLPLGHSFLSVPVCLFGLRDEGLLRRRPFYLRVIGPAV